MSVTIIHTSDWQIGKQFAKIGGDTSSLLRQQRLGTIERIAEVARERKAAAVLVAGDVFDSGGVSDETVRRTMNALKGFQGPWLLLPGNHDPALAESPWTRMARFGMPENVHLLTEPRPWVSEDGVLAVLPAPLPRKRETADLTEWFDQAETPSGALRIGMAHGSVANRLPGQSEGMNVISDRRAETARLDYLALGDWHGTLEIAPCAWYSGTHEPDRFRENDPGNVLVVQLSRPGSDVEVEKVRVGGYRWLSLDQTVHDPDDVGAVSGVLEALGEPFEDTLLWLRLSGTIGLEVRERLEKVLDEWRARLLHLRVDDEELVAEPSADDLDQIDKAGFVRSAIDELRAMSDDPANPEREVARRALQVLYGEHVKTQG